jgi:hypothetical protein
MALETFFEINLPYLMVRHTNMKDYWVCLNREYRLIGTVNDDLTLYNIPDKYYVKYKDLNEEKILLIADKEDYSVRKNDKEEIIKFYLHNSPKNYKNYLERLELLFKIKKIDTLK